MKNSDYDAYCENERAFNNNTVRTLCPFLLAKHLFLPCGILLKVLKLLGLNKNNSGLGLI